uniref:Uncharacterized protein n=1 Tax=Myoviridae sp. ctIty1 TaxID=2827673 RepID=A0A8S5TI11_9CAUD|nr:MAG TPA: hypothetical protein [Myoviridae sp. ctIty1]
MRVSLVITIISAILFYTSFLYKIYNFILKFRTT